METFEQFTGGFPFGEKIVFFAKKKEDGETVFIAPKARTRARDRSIKRPDSTFALDPILSPSRYTTMPGGPSPDFSFFRAAQTMSTGFFPFPFSLFLFGGGCWGGGRESVRRGFSPSAPVRSTADDNPLIREGR